MNKEQLKNLEPLLFKAVEDEDLTLIEFFVKNGVNVNCRNIYGRTPLINAREPKIIAKLLDMGADINAKSEDNNTALIKNSFWENKKCVELLLKRGADLSIRNNTGRTALDYAIQDENDEIVEILKKYMSNNKPNTVEITYELSPLITYFNHINYITKAFKCSESDFTKVEYLPRMRLNDNGLFVPSVLFGISHDDFQLSELDTIEIYIRKKPKC